MVMSETFVSRTNRSRGSAAVVYCAGPWWGEVPWSMSAVFGLCSSLPVGRDENTLAQSFPV